MKCTHFIFRIIVFKCIAVYFEFYAILYFVMLLYESVSLVNFLLYWMHCIVYECYTKSGTYFLGEGGNVVIMQYRCVLYSRHVLQFKCTSYCVCSYCSCRSAFNTAKVYMFTSCNSLMTFGKVYMLTSCHMSLLLRWWRKAI